MRISNLVRLVVLVGLTAVIDPVSASAATLDDLGASNVASQTLTRSDGSIYVIGQSSDQTLTSNDNVILRLAPDGALDTTWAEGGVKILPPGTFDGGVVAPDGGLFYASQGSLFKVDHTGARVHGFGDNGEVRGPDTPLDGWITRFAVDSQGRVVAESPTALVRFDSSGALDESFGTDGLVTLDHGGLVTTDRSDRVILFGKKGEISEVTRFLADGSLDTSFGPDHDGSVAVGPFPTDNHPSDVTVGSDGATRAAVAEFGTYRACMGTWHQFAFDETGLPVADQTHDLGCGVRAATPVGGWASAVVQGPGIEAPSAFEVRLTRGGDDDLWRRDYQLSPGRSGALGIESPPGTDRLLASGGVSGGAHCPSHGCSVRSSMVVTMLDASTGDPIENFGIGGSVVIPRNTCPYGKAPGADRSWMRCRVQPPRVVGRSVVGGSARPRLKTRVILPSPPVEPGLLTQIVRIRIPAGLRLTRRGLKGRVVAVAKGSSTRGKVSKAVKGRSITVRFRPRRPRRELGLEELTNPKARFTILARRGAFKPLKRSSTKRWRTRVKAGYVPEMLGSADWYTPGYTLRGLRVARGHRGS